MAEIKAETREEAIARVMRELRLDREDAERFVDYVDGRMRDVADAEDDGATAATRSLNR